MIRFLQSLALGFLVSCGSAQSTPFNRNPTTPLTGPTSSPTDPNHPATPVKPDSPDSPPATDYCAPDAAGVYAEHLLLDKGEANSPRYFKWGKGGGCVSRPIRDVWAVLHNHELVMWDMVSEEKVSLQAAPENVYHHFSVEYFVHDFITVSWVMEWYHSVTKGTLAAPEEVVVNYQRVRGTKYIPYWEGSIVLVALNKSVTSFFMVNQIDATRTSVDDAASTVSDLYKKLQTGNPDWAEFNR